MLSGEWLPIGGRKGPWWRHRGGQRGGGGIPCGGFAGRLRRGGTDEKIQQRKHWGGRR